MDGISNDMSKGTSNGSSAVDRKYDLIKRRIPPELLWTPETLKEALSRTDRLPRVLWLTAPTGKPHLGYLIPLLKFADFLRAGCEITVDIFDTYSYLDNINFSVEQVAQRTEVYYATIMAALSSLGVDCTRIKFVRESSYDKSPEFIRDQWKLCTLISQDDVRSTWERAVHPTMLSPMLGPVFQTLSEEYNDCDIHFGGEDQPSLFRLADRFLPQIGYRTRAHIMNSMLPNLQGGSRGKMSSSHPSHTKLTYIESDESICEKLQLAWESTRSDLQNCGPLRLLRDILMPISLLQSECAADSEFCRSVGITDAKLRAPFWIASDPDGTLFTVCDTHFKSFDQVIHSLTLGDVDEKKLLDAISNAVCQIVSSTRTAFEKDKLWQDAHAKGYPGGEEGVFGH